MTETLVLERIIQVARTGERGDICGEAIGPFASEVLELNTLYKRLYRLAYVSPQKIP
jgi:hypothetical protein